MIRVIMLGRTGNNLFQYAAARVLAIRHGAEIVMDGSWFDREGWASVRGLRDLPIEARMRRGFSPASRLRRRLTGRHRWEGLGLPVIREREGFSGYQKGLLEGPSDCVLMGYFQSPRYFEGIADEVRRELDLERLAWPDEVRREAGELSAGQSVAVHVRRTDFLGRVEFEVCGPDYYRRAMDELRARFEGLSFRVFSDDPAWCERQMAGGDVTVRASRDAGPWTDLYLMSRTRHHIIANSSFSWWAAWLGKKPGQEVRVPPRWHGGGIEAPIEDKLCEGWKIVS